MPKEYYVYIVRCSDGSLYTGLASELEERFCQHQDGFYKNCYTYKRRPVELVYCSEFREVHESIEWERRVKR